MQPANSDTLDDSFEHSLIDAEKNPQLVVALEGDRPLAGSARFSLQGVDEVLIGRGEARAVERRTVTGVQQLILTFPARSLSSLHARLLRSQGQWLLEDAQSRNGSFVDGQRVESVALASTSVLQLGHVFLLLRPAMTHVEGDAADLDGSLSTKKPIATRTVLPALSRSFDSVARVAETGIPLLVRGETGTGKEELARAVHELSRRKGPFIPASCSTLTPEHLSSLLQRAQPGATLFLDEIGDLSEPSQVSLLSSLQSSSAAANSKLVDVLLISSTHLKAAELLAPSRLRRDLHARLSGYVVSLPRLADRLEDLGNLISSILQGLPTSSEHVRFTASAGTALLTHDWPLNVRELKNGILSSVALTDDGIVHLAHLPQSVTSRVAQRSAAPLRISPPTRSDEERRLNAVLVSKLAEYGGNVAAVSRALNKAPMQVHRWMRRFGIDPREFRVAVKKS